jgi:uncharacterized protein (DUF2141 family)
MKKLFLFLLGYLLISNICFSQFKLTIEIAEIRNDKGTIMLELFDNNQNVIKQEMGAIKNNFCLISISELKTGKYAVRFYHDENQNGKMETNSFGKPTEGFGFSNNVVGIFGAPEFEKWLFEINSDTTINLKPVYK